MKRAVLSDIHANMEALTAVLAAVEELDCDEVLCLGDLVGYGPDPEAVVDLVRARGIPTVRGNHDDATAHPNTDRSFNAWAREAIRWTRDRLDPDRTAFLGGLPISLRLEWALAVHAAPSAPSDWPYVLSLNDAAREFEAFEGRVCVIGHSHVPMAVALTSGTAESVPGEEACLRTDSRYLINVGSVGQPRDGDPRASFGVFDEEGATYRLVRVDYDCRRTARKIVDAGLPAVLGERLLVGQ